MIWRGFWKDGLEQGLEGKKDLRHKVGKKRVYVGKSQEMKVKRSEKNGKIIQGSSVQAF